MTDSHEKLLRPAVDLLTQSQSATLSTHSQKHAGYPYASTVKYALAPLNQPILLLSDLATHTRNIRLNSKCSLFVQKEFNLDSSRLTLLGELERVETDKSQPLRQTYLQQIAESAPWIEFADFSIYKFNLVEAYFVGGFGMMGWVTPDQFNTFSG